jgi:hypothetical protein
MRPLPYQAIQEVAELLVDLDRWTRETHARNADNFGCDPRDQQATTWCVIGALLRAGFRLTGRMDEAVRITERAAEILVGRRRRTGNAVQTLVRINDVEGHAAICRLLAAARDRF